MKVSVLGTEYEVQICRRNEDLKLKNNPDISGYCDFSSKRIVVVNEVIESMGDTDSMDNLDTVVKNVLRHEIIHSFAFQSGLDSCSPLRDELIIDWIAIQLPKMWEAYASLEPEVTQYLKDSVVNAVLTKSHNKKKGK